MDRVSFSTMRSKLPQRSYSPAVAAILSLIPGLGHAYVGRPRRGLTLAIPWLAVVAAALLVVVFDHHALVYAATGSSAWLTSLTLVMITLLVLHAFVIVDAFRLAGGSLSGLTRATGAARLAAPIMIGIILATTLVYGTAATATYSGVQALSKIFGEAPAFVIDNGTPGPSSSAGSNDNAIDTLPPDPSASGSTGGSSLATKAPVVYALGNLPNFTGTAKDWAADGYLNVLLIGIDAGPGGSRYSGLRPDSMILLQVNIASGRAAMYGIPRNLINVPLPPDIAKHYACHCYGAGPGQLNANFLIDYLWNEAANVHPSWYSVYGSGSSTTAKFLRGLGALEGAVSELAGLQVDGSVVINLPGFVTLINALAPNGLSINIPYEVRQDKRFGYSPANGGPDLHNIDIKAGPQIINGDVALEYARLRHVIGYDSDYYRMKRQQLVLRAVRDQINPCALLPQVPAILNALGGTIWTNLPQSDAPTVAALAAKVGTSNTASFSLDPSATGASYDVLDQTSVNKIHSIVAHGLDSVPSGIGGGSGGGGGGGLSC
jgi:anionic cell wall polymer biosynthesis LytR-Cps2A-Psr (LCP) family protein